MEAKFTNYSKGAELENCTFRLPKTIGGTFILDAIYSNIKPSSDNWFYSYEELKGLSNFRINNKKGQSSKYKTFAGFIKRLKNEI